jgi:hypothetical protein
VVAGILVVTRAPEVPDVPKITCASGIPEVCPGVGDTDGWDVFVHAETRNSAKSNPTKMTESFLFFILDDVMIEELIRNVYPVSLLMRVVHLYNRSLEMPPR